MLPGGFARHPSVKDIQLYNSRQCSNSKGEKGQAVQNQTRIKPSYNSVTAVLGVSKISLTVSLKLSLKYS